MRTNSKLVIYPLLVMIVFLSYIKHGNPRRERHSINAVLQSDDEEISVKCSMIEEIVHVKEVDE